LAGPPPLEAPPFPPGSIRSPFFNPSLQEGSIPGFPTLIGHAECFFPPVFLRAPALVTETGTLTPRWVFWGPPLKRNQVLTRTFSRRAARDGKPLRCCPSFWNFQGPLTRRGGGPSRSTSPFCGWSPFPGTFLWPKRAAFFFFASPHFGDRLPLPAATAIFRRGLFFPLWGGTVRSFLFFSRG